MSDIPPYLTFTNFLKYRGKSCNLFAMSPTLPYFVTLVKHLNAIFTSLASVLWEMLSTLYFFAFSFGFLCVFIKHLINQYHF